MSSVGSNPTLTANKGTWVPVDSLYFIGKANKTEIEVTAAHFVCDGYL